MLRRFAVFGNFWSIQNSSENFLKVMLPAVLFVFRVVCVLKAVLDMKCIKKMPTTRLPTLI
ncbi:hypothetical protein GBA52_025826 [Prunus armeniaca]|nr:hypothetical protein GBA52_025826 [Prunus armeniaca]